MAGITPLLALLLVVAAAAPAFATDYTVGDSQQWTLGVTYSTWLSGKTFKVGDNLVFKYSSSHDVAEVNKADYDSCSTNNIIKTYTDGNTTIALNSTGSRYFICSIGNHCSQGMKLEVSVSSSPSTPPPSSSPSPPSSPPPPPSGGSSAPPPPANGPSSQSPPPPPPPSNGAINMSPYKMSTLFFGVLVLCVGLIA